jgi:hypothetical protein
VAQSDRGAVVAASSEAGLAVAAVGSGVEARAHGDNRVSTKGTR